MQELMEWIYSKLSALGDTYFEELERNKDGEVFIDDLQIVYNIPNVLKTTDNKARRDIPLQIDIWGRKDQALDIENLIVNIDSTLENEVYRSDTLFFIINKQTTWILNIKDEDKNIRRKQLNYTIRLYK